LQGLPVISDIKISRFQDELLFFTEKGIYQFNEDTHKFTTFLTNIENFIPTSTSIFRFIEDHKGNCWIRANGEPDWTEVIYKQNDGSFRRDTIAFKRLPAMSVQTIYPETNGITWIGGSDGLYSYNTKVKPVIGTQYQTLIRKVTIGRDSIIFNGTFHSLDSIIGLIPTFEQDQNSLPVFDYKFNSVIFHFVAPFFEDEKVLQYSYFLEGFDENWSDWTNENKAGYTNLNAGDYIFRVKAKNIYGIESSEAKFSFTVQPPWYRTFFAYLLYVVAAIVLIWGLVKLNTQRLIHEKKNLERIVTERTAEIRRQAKELEKLSLVASETDNAIVIMQADGTFDWINAGFTRLFGFTLDDLVAQKRNSIMAFNNQVDANELNNCIQNKMSINYEAAIRTGNEDLVWVQVTLTPVLDKSGVLIRIIAINSDITVQKLYLAEILQQKEEIEAQRDEIEKQRDEIEKQRDEIAEHQKSIMDSILYASRIQTALLPPEQIMSTIIADHFILYKPRDVVSGDFYWMTQRDNRIIVAVADCTGHGVPGAFMSMLGIAFLNEIVVKTNPNEVLNAHDILNRLREHVISALRQTGGDGEAKDGMDISLCVINLDVNKLQFAGAYNPAYLVRATSNNQPELIQIDADKMPIGIHYRKDKLFSVKEVDISKGDALYMLSDGYVDQFGGPDGKKFMSKGFKNLLLSIQNETMREQKRHIEKALTDWMSYHDPDGKQYQQIDDILVMGLRF